jgi:hypothetical protein
VWSAPSPHHDHLSGGDRLGLLHGLDGQLVRVDPERRGQGSEMAVRSTSSGYERRLRGDSSVLARFLSFRR